MEMSPTWKRLNKRLTIVRRTFIFLTVGVFVVLSLQLIDTEVYRAVANYLALTYNTNNILPIFVSNTSYDAYTINRNEHRVSTKNENAEDLPFYKESAGNKSNNGRLDQMLDSSELFSTCVYPKVNPFEPSVVKVAGLDKKPIHCERTFLPDITYITDNKIWINTSLVEQYFGRYKFQHCRFCEIFRHQTNDNWFRTSKWSKPFNVSATLRENSEFILVQCTNTTSHLVSKSYYSLIPRKPEFDEIYSLNFKKHQVESAPKETLNVIMIGLDSLPRNHFIRSMNKTYEYLMNAHKSFDLTMHAQLGQNTFPNFLPLFTGQSYEETCKWWNDTNYMDSLDLLWRKFENTGYRTLFTEDWPHAGAFHYLKKGFTLPFARYNMRPLAVAMDTDKELWKYNKYCAGNKLEVNFQLDYLSRFLESFPDKPVFSVAMFTKVTHDYLTDAKIIDDHMCNFYKSLSERGHLNRSLLISFSDHGPRWGEIRNSVNGLFESQTPYTILTFPDWFLTKYPDVAKNLQINTERLTTHFDTHSTLLDLLHFKSENPLSLAQTRHGTSLFDVIPLNRTCKDASIPQDFCICGIQSMEDISVKSELAKKLGQLVLQSVNSRIDHSFCAVLTIKTINKIMKLALYLNSDKEKQKNIIFKVKLTTSPGDALFEANVYPVNTTAWAVGRDIGRLNLYRGQADCVHVAKDRPFCYCKNLLKKYNL